MGLTWVPSSCTTEPPLLSSSSAWHLSPPGSTSETQSNALPMESPEEQWTSIAGSTPHSQCQGLGVRLERNMELDLQKRSVKTNHTLGWHHQMMRWSITNTTSGSSLSSSFRLLASTFPV